ncbi:MAG TPA: ribulose-phosphate 3-epimerase [Anseongella sp.]|nr:ribulose-phosphate 3-epimerase [Anseongella sp.]
MKHLIAPSILSADFAHLYDDIKMINESVADWFHVDVMDGNFVPNISFGFPVISSLQHYAKKPLDVHLMILQPERYLEDFKRVGAKILTVHYEACTHLHRTVNAIRELGMKAGVAINPHTPVHLLEDILPEVDLVLVMSVNPGFGGQNFIENTYRKLRTLRNMREGGDHNFLIEVDGGISQHNALALLKAGADVLVAGNSIFSAEDPREEIAEMKKIRTDILEA